MHNLAVSVSDWDKSQVQLFDQYLFYQPSGILSAQYALLLAGMTLDGSSPWPSPVLEMVLPFIMTTIGRLYFRLPSEGSATFSNRNLQLPGAAGNKQQRDIILQNAMENKSH